MQNRSFEERANLDDVIYWHWTSMKQLERLRQSFDAQMNAMESFDPRQGYSLQHKQINVLTAADTHFLLVAVTNLIKAMSKQLPPGTIQDRRLDMTMSEKIKHLRNIYEHWEETREVFSKQLAKKKSAKWYEDNYPGMTPWSLSWDVNGLVVCGILSIDELSSELTDIMLALASYVQSE